ncbi:MAG: prepilin-type N-terminal cleavage/methylation domain-containing protein, partial [Akkermansiaceae bacterium]
MKRGFTMTELLVVVAIVIVLAGVALPVITGMRERVLQASCVSQLRGLGVAMEGYLSDNG